jgi:hypothetical protein
MDDQPPPKLLRPRLHLDHEPCEREPIKSYNPDLNPSYSKTFKDEVTPDVLRTILQVKGLGCVVIRANRTDRSVVMSIVTKDDVGPCPDI